MTEATVFSQIWRRLVSVLLPAPPRIVHEGFKPLEVEATAVRLRLREQGLANGRLNLPAADTVAYDGPQAAVVQEVRKHIATNLARALGELEELARRIRLAAADEPAARVRAAGDECLRAIEAAKREAALPLRRARAVADEREERLRRFRAEHGLERGAEYPQSALLAWMLVLLLAVLESLLNVYFFTQGSDYGVVGGLATSIAFAAIDLFICATTGRWATNLNHRAAWRKLAGGLAVVVALVWIPAWALVTGHLREALARSPEGFDQAFSAARVTLSATPFGFERLDTWALVGLGIILSIGGFISGWRLDDPYPGYGRVARAAAGAREEHEDEIERLANRLEGLADKGRRAMQQRVAEYDALVGGLAATVATAEVKRNTIRIFVGQVGQSTAALLHAYRNANLSTRSAPPPAYFDQADALPPEATPALPEFPQAPAREVLRARAAEAATVLEEMRERIRAAAAAAAAAIGPEPVSRP